MATEADHGTTNLVVGATRVATRAGEVLAEVAMEVVSINSDVFTCMCV